MTGPRLDTVDAQIEAGLHLDACRAAMHAYEESGDEALLDESPAVGPFCGCDDCDKRELLAAFTPKLLQLVAGWLNRSGEPHAAALVHAESIRHDQPPLARAALEQASHP